MDSQKFALPLWLPQNVAKRLLEDSLEWGPGDLPPISQLPNLWTDLAAGKNIFHRLPKRRRVITGRLIPGIPRAGWERREAAHDFRPGIEDFFLLMPLKSLLPLIKNADPSSGLPFIRDLFLKELNHKEKYSLALNNNEIFYKYIESINLEDSDDGDIATLEDYIDTGDSLLFLYSRSRNNSSCDMETFTNNGHLSPINFYDHIASDILLDMLRDVDQDGTPIDFIVHAVKIKWRPAVHAGHFLRTPLEQLLDADNQRLRLPTLSRAWAKDRGGGLWDVWWPEGEAPEKQWYVAAELEESCVARDPWRDVQDGGVVCIDFGTSSTVAAVQEKDNSVRMLRLDVSGMEVPSGAGHDPYENPTALEFANLEETLLPWRNEPWRPLVQWKHVKCSHLARNELRQGRRAESGLQAIKTWARALPGTSPVRLRDERGTCFTLSPLPVEEAAESAGPGDFAARPLDPIELYAYFLGLACNNQAFFGGRIYREYAMTFPVKFPREVRERILQGFRHGLVRSMPCSLGSSRRWQQEKNPFRLTERASEPTAFAAGVLPWLGIEPTQGGVPFAVFDFGGGTTDFAFGLWRLPTPVERANEPWEQVLDILDVAGDENLGGERLLELLAYELLRGNAENRAACAKAGVTFMPPSGEALFDGSELLFTTSGEARANTVTLCELLRPLWEEGRLSDDDTGLLKANLIDHKGVTANIELKVNEDALREILKKRILKGVRAFFAAFRQAFKAHGIRPQELHVLLAGNSCRSPLVRDAFEICLDDIVPNERESVIIHDEMLPGGATDAVSAPPGQVAADGSIRPTLKTGVALGLLRLLPGEATGMVERNRAGESPFLHTVGSFSNNVLQPLLPRNAEYGQWHVAGRVFREGVSLLGYTLAPEAIEQECPRSACHQLRLEWGEENFGKYLFIRAVAPGRMEAALGTAADGLPDKATIRTYTLEG